jgi:hypothetical protein
MHIGYLWKRQKQRDHWKDQDVGGLTILKWILREIGWDGVDWTDMVQDREPVEGSYEQGIEHSGCLKCWEVLEWLHNWLLLKKGSAP